MQTDTGINITQSGPNGFVWTGTDVFVNRVIAPGETKQVSFTANFDGVAILNQRPGNFQLNGRRCTLA